MNLRDLGLEPPEDGWPDDDGWSAAFGAAADPPAEDGTAPPTGELEAAAPTIATPAASPDESWGFTSAQPTVPDAGPPPTEAAAAVRSEPVMSDPVPFVDDAMATSAVVGAPLSDTEAGDGPANPLQRVRDARRRAGEDRYRKRQRRWETQRYAVPYDVAGPKVTLGVVWFVLLAASLRYGAWLALVTLVVTAAVAGLQTGFAWSRHALSDRRMTAAAAVVVAAAGFGQRFGLGLVVIVATLALTAYALATVGTDARGTSFAETLVRSSLPAGLAAGSLVALRIDEPGAFLVVLLLVSAYEMGDFLIGSGAPNAIEGPIAGLVAQAVVTYALITFPPDPFTSTTMPAFALLAAIGAVLGPVAASAILPRGNAWAPGLRRLDSHLLTAPLFLLLT